MRNTPALARREMLSLFASPLAYTLLTVFLLFGGLSFTAMTAEYKQAGRVVEGLNGLLSFLFLVITPLMTMRLLSEEYRSGNIEHLMTAPVTEWEVTLAKFLGAFALYAAMLAPTLAYPLILSALGKPDWGVVASAYAGLLLLGAEFLALGVLCSALTANQIVAALLAFLAQLALWLLGPISSALGRGFRAAALYASASEHFQPFLEGRIAFRDVFYFVSLTVFGLFLAVRALESRRWR